MTVWVVHGQSGGQHDLTPAAKFGDIRYVNQFYIHGDELTADMASLVNVGYVRWTLPVGWRVNMERAVAQFDPDNDYLLIFGDHLQLLALTMMLAAKFHCISVLRWDRKLNDYIPVRLHSGLVAPGQPVLASSSDIGDTDVQGPQSRDQDRTKFQDRARRVAEKADRDASRPDPRTRDSS